MEELYALQTEKVRKMMQSCKRYFATKLFVIWLNLVFVIVFVVEICGFLGANSPPLCSLFPATAEKSINKTNIRTNNGFIYINISFILTNISLIYSF